MFPSRALSVTLLTTALLAACGKSDEPHQAATPAPPVAQTAEGTPAPRREETPSGIIKRPAAKATPDEWRAIQAFTKRVWGLATKQQNAYDLMRKKQMAALENGNAGAIALAIVRYREALQSVGQALDETSAPDVADENTARYMDAALTHYTLALTAEQRKIQGIIDSAIDGRDVPKSESDGHTREANGNSALTVLNLNRIYWNHGYDSNDIDGRTFTPKKGAKPSATVEFNDS